MDIDRLSPASNAISTIRAHLAPYSNAETMAVPIVLASLDKSIRDKIENELQFQYRENTIVKSKNGGKTPVVVHCHMPISNDCIALPMFWVWKNLELSNDYETPRRAYKNVMEPWNKLQEDELAQTVDMLTKKKS